MKRSIKFGLSIVTIGLLVSGCGSDGGGSSSLFKEAKKAPASVDSGKEVAKNISANSMSTGLNSFSTDESTDTITDAGSNIVMVSSGAVKYSKKYMKKNSSYALNEAFDETEECDTSGTVRYKGAGSESAGGTVLMTFNNCKMDGETMNGSMKMEVDGGETYMHLSFPTDITIEKNNKKTKIFKNSKIDMTHINAGGSNYDMESTIKVDVDGKLYGSDHSIWKIVGSKMYQTSGKEYINNLDGYVTFDSSYDMSKTPLVYSYNGLTSGEAHYIGENDGKIILKVTGKDEITVKIDADNDGVFETEEVVKESTSGSM